MNRTQKQIIGWGLVGLAGLMVIGAIANAWRTVEAIEQLLRNPFLYIGLSLGVAGVVVLVGLKREGGGARASGAIESNKKNRSNWLIIAPWFGIGVLLLALGIIATTIVREGAHVGRNIPSDLFGIRNAPDVGNLSFDEFIHESRPPDAMDIPIDKEAPVGVFTIGSSKAKILEAQGEPSYKRNYVWWYDDCRVFFDKNERVWGYKNPSGKLKILLIPMKFLEKPVRSFKVGSDQIEVIGVLGTPTEVVGVKWKYGRAWVEFEKGKVKKIVNFNDQLKIAEEK